VLGHQGHQTGDLASPVLARRPAVDEHRAGDRCQHAVDQVEQRALAAAVRPDHADELARRDVERQALEDGAIDVVGIRRPLHGDDRRR
jgi:hypothetical protein